MGIFCNIWEKLFHYDELTINMRQKDDLEYSKMLSRIRIGYLSNDDLKKLEGRKITFTDTDYDKNLVQICNYIDNLPTDTLCLLPKRRMCEILNTEMLTLLPSEEIKLIARDSLECPPYLKKKDTKALDSDDEKCSKTGGLPKIIVIKIGAKVMLTRNIDVSQGLVNGTVGIVKSIKTNLDDKNDVQQITIRLSSGEERIIERMNVKFEVIDKAFVVRNQFPLTLSYAITIHKAQGMSIKNAVVDAGNNMFIDGQAYVAFSRVTALEGLHLVNFDPCKITASSKAIHEYNRLKKTYRPDLALLEQGQINFGTVMDNNWFISKYLNECQEVYEPIDMSNTKEMYGLTNDDSVSCYANSVIQCLFNCSLLTDAIMKLPKTNILHISYESYKSKQKVDVMAIRQFVDESFSLLRQQDAPEFLQQLLNKVPTVDKIVQHSIKYKVICASEQCQYVSERIEENSILQIDIESPRLTENKSLSLQEMIKNFNKTDHFEGKCSNCESRSLIHKMEIQSLQQLLIIQLQFFNNRESITYKITNPPEMKGLSNGIFKFLGKKYKLISAIFHHGISMESGHYTSMFRVNNNWIEANDLTITKRNWPRNSKNVYVLLLQEK